MNIRAVSHLLSYLLLFLGVGQVMCGFVATGFGDSGLQQWALYGPGSLAALAGAAGAWLSRHADEEMGHRDGIMVVAAGWLLLTLYGATPYLLAGIMPDFMSAWFESVSGFTTTGASVIDDVDPLPKGLLFWRSMTHLFGGIGILILCVAILPYLGTGGYQVYSNEATGISKERLTPRIASTAKMLYGTYGILVLLDALALKIGGMTLFDALCHAFGTVATGGFSTHTASIGHYNSLYIEIVTLVFMFLGATNFVLHIEFARTGRLSIYRGNEEFRFFFKVWLFVCAAVGLNVWLSGVAGPGRAFRDSFFTVTSLMTTTGFVTVDFDRWPAFAVCAMLAGMICGGCSGSTAGAVKIDRILVGIKRFRVTLRNFLQRKAVLSVKLNDKPVPPDSVTAIMVFLLLYLATIAIASLLLMLWVPSARSSISAVIATLGGVGPGVGVAGPMETYSSIPAAGKSVLIACMLLGRLEFYALIIVFAPSFWKH